MSIKKLSNLPFILTSQDAVVYHENLSVNLEQLSKIQPAGSYVLFLTENKWEMESVPINVNKYKLELIGETDSKLLLQIEQLKRDLKGRDISRLFLLPNLPEALKDTFIQCMDNKKIEVVVYSENEEVTEDDFETGEDSEDFEKRLKDLGYM